MLLRTNVSNDTKPRSYNGELDYMERSDRVERRENPSMILPGVQAVVMVGMHYWPGKTGFPERHEVRNHHEVNLSGEQSRGVISSYAWGDDYHAILSKRLKALGKYLNSKAGGLGRFYVDTGAILERDFAERAGFGFVGKNTLLINPRSGSGFFIGEMFTTVPLPLDGDEDRGTRGTRKGEAGCGKCSKCRVACPTNAIVKDHVVDARRCISYLTIELKGSIPEELRRDMGNKIYGCDICQQVCPWNRLSWEWKREEDLGKSKSNGFSPLFGVRDEDVTTPMLVELLAMDEEGFKKRFKGSAVKRIGRERLARNVAVALGNIGGKGDLEVLEDAAKGDESALVREHATWAVERIKERLDR